MSPELQQKLYDKYPKIFANKDKSIRESCMGWGICTNDGWYDLIDILCNKIQYYCDQRDWYPENIIIRKLKQIWNVTMWNYVFYPIASKILLDNIGTGSRPPEYFKSFKWKTYQWIQKRFSLQDRYKESTTPRSQVVADQVKEKMGGLRFYASGGDKTTNAYVDFAESMSYHICENCGSTKDVTRSTGWITVRCAECRSKAAKKDL